jgi:Raf kinase inhibitor-like YbhB/YbcL family protein
MMVGAMRALVAIAALTVALAGCGGGEKLAEPPPTAPEQIKLTSPAFKKNDTIPTIYTCDGDELSPPLAWSDVPKDAKELALLVTDPDAPGGSFVHWTVFGIAPSVKSIPENSAPAGAKQGENSAGDLGYGGPCPPEGDSAHRYVFALYALDQESGLKQGASPDEVRSALDREALARGQLIAKFKR